MTRTLAALVAALVATLTLAYAPARAEPQAGASALVGQPLNLTPSLRQTQQLHHTTVEHAAAAKPPQSVTHHRVMHTARAASRSHDGGVVVRGQDLPGRDTGSLLAMLPWWRADPMETIRYLDREAGSGVLAAAEAWLAAPIAESHAAATGHPTQHASSDDVNEFDLTADAGFVDADELNAMDLLAVAITDPRKSDNSWLHTLLAMLAGALAAASTARYLFG